MLWKCVIETHPHITDECPTKEAIPMERINEDKKEELHHNRGFTLMEILNFRY